MKKLVAIFLLLQIFDKQVLFAQESQRNFFVNQKNKATCKCNCYFDYPKRFLFFKTRLKIHITLSDKSISLSNENWFPFTFGDMQNISGYLSYKFNKVYFKRDTLNGSESVLFDFDQNVGDTTELNNIGIIQGPYVMKLDERIINLKDSIFSYKLNWASSYPRPSHSDTYKNMIVGKRSGIKSFSFNSGGEDTFCNCK